MTDVASPVEPAALAGLPVPVRQRLRELQISLKVVLTDRLVALLVHGSAARGEYHPGSSDVDLLVVVREAPTALLEAVAEPLQLARNAARIESMILIEDELPSTACFFPLLYDEIRRRHVLLEGKDPFAGIVVSDEHRRLRLGQELRDLQIRLRRLIVDAYGNRAQLSATVDRKLKQLRGPLHVLLTLIGTPPPDDQLDSVLKAAARRFDLNGAALQSPSIDPHAALEALATLLTRAMATLQSEKAPSS